MSKDETIVVAKFMRLYMESVGYEWVADSGERQIIMQLKLIPPERDDNIEWIEAGNTNHA